METNTQTNIERIAVIDLGSNAVRLVISNVVRDSEGMGHFIVFDELKEQLQLAADIDRDGFLKPPRIAQAVKILKMFKKMCFEHKVTSVHAFATSAIKRAKNLKSFLEEVQAISGFKIRVLDDEEEAMLIYQGVINSMEIPKAVIMDLSGSSCQFIQYNRRNVLNRVSLPFGTITLNQIFNDVTPSEKQSAMMQEYVLDHLRQVEWFKELDADTQIIGVGGTFRNIAKIAKRLRRYPLNMIHNYTVERDVFNSIFDSVKVLPVEQRLKIKGLSAQRADLFLAGLSCIKAFVDLISGTSIVVSGYGIREGIMFKNTMPQAIERPITDVIWHSVYTTMHNFDVNIPHAEHVCNLSIQLYKQLRVLHKLPRQYVRILRAAALLHDAGMRIKFYDHATHSLYFILNANLSGFTHREIILSAFVAQAHRKSGIDLTEWAKYSGIVKDEDLVAVMKLGIILRIAESLDRTMSGSVKGLNCDVLGESVIMKTDAGGGDCSLEIKEALNSCSEFARVYRKNLEIL